MTTDTNYPDTMTKDQYMKVVERTLDSMKEIIRKKNHDYTGGADDPFANFRVAEMEGVTPVQGILIRLQDKLQRIRTYNSRGELLVADEGFTDACDDVIGYALLIKGMLLEKAARESQARHGRPLALVQTNKYSRDLR